MTPPAADPPDRRAQILTAARELFTTQGFDRTSMAEIVQASGVATGTVYRYFASKEEIILAACEAITARAFAEAVASQQLNGEQATAIILQGATDPISSRFATQVWARAAFSPQLRERLLAQEDVMRDALARAIAGTGSDPPPGAFARADAVIFALSGLRERIASGFDVDLDGFRDAISVLLSDR